MKKVSVPGLLRCAATRKRIAEETKRLNERVKRASGGRLHHQACRLGGLFTGMGADISDSPCWCVPIIEEILP